MKKIFLFIAYFPFIFFTSCKSHKHRIEKKLEKCIAHKFDKPVCKYDTLKPADYYQVMSQMEKYFIAEKLLKNISKESYIKMIDKILNESEANKNNLYNKLLLIARKNNYTGLFSTIDMFDYCPYYIKSTEKNIPASMKKQFNAMEKLFAFDPYNQNYINELVNSVTEKDFKKLTYRVPVITILFEYLDYFNRKINRKN